MAQLVKNMSANAGDARDDVLFLGQEDPLRRNWQPTLVFLLEKSHGQRSLVGYSPWGHKDLDTAELTGRIAWVRLSRFQGSGLIKYQLNQPFLTVHQGINIFF